jgi:multiple sugar transport system substrate-binding protein
MRTTSRSRRRSLALLALSVSASTLALAACGQADTSSSGEPSAAPTLSTEDVELRIAYWGADARVALTDEAIAAFEAKYPTIDVTGEFGDWSGYWDKLATTTAGGSAADVIQMDQLYLASYADRGALADLEGLEQLDTSKVEESVLDIGRSDGTLYGMPISTTAFSLMVNQDLIDSLGLTLPDTETWTWDDLADFSEQVTEASGGTVVGIGPMNNEYSLQLWARQHGEDLFTDGDVSISKETLADYFQLALDWSTSGAGAPASQYAEQATAGLDQSDFATRKQAMSFTQVTQLAAYQAATGGANLVPVKIPTDDANEASYNYLKPGMYWSAASTSEHPAEAALLIDFLVNDPEAGQIFGTERGIPANTEIRDAITPSLPPVQQKTVEFVASLEPTLGEAPQIVPNGASELDQIIQRTVLEVMFERQSADEAAEAFLTEVQSSIDAAN